MHLRRHTQTGQLERADPDLLIDLLKNEPVRHTQFRPDVLHDATTSCHSASSLKESAMPKKKDFAWPERHLARAAARNPSDGAALDDSERACRHPVIPM